MGINHIELATGETLIDLREDTVTEDSLLQGYTAHNSTGERITGTRILEKEVIIIPMTGSEEDQYSIKLEDTSIIQNYDGSFLLYLSFGSILIPYFNENIFCINNESSVIYITVNLETGICTLEEKRYESTVEWNDILNKPVNVSDFFNNVGYLTSIPDEYITEQELNGKGYLTSIPDNYITQEELNGKGYLTSIPEEYITNEELNQKGYLTSIPDDYITEQELNGKGYLTYIPNEYITNEELNQKGYLTSIPDNYITNEELNGKGYLTSIPDDYITSEKLKVSLENKQDLLTFDSIPSKNSENPIKSGGVYDSIENVIAIANGKSASYVFDDKDSLTTWLMNHSNISELKKGDVFLLREINWPDYWWEPIEENVSLTEYTEKDIIIPEKGAARILETTKIDVPIYLSELIEDTNHQTITEEERVIWNNKSNFNGSYTNLSNIPRVTKRGAPSEAGYYLLGTLPVKSSSGNYASFIFNGRFGGWETSNSSTMQIMIMNRNGVSGTVSMSYTASDITRIWNNFDIIVFEDSEGAANVYMKCNGYFLYDFEWLSFDATFAYNNTYSTEVPSGTNVWQLSTAPKTTTSATGVFSATGGISGLSKVATSNNFHDLDNRPIAAVAGYNGYIYTSGDGVAEMGKYIDFHATADHTGDFSTRLTCIGNGNTLNIPSGSGTLTFGDKQYMIKVSSSAPTTNDTSVITFVL